MPAATIDGDADDETPLERAITVAFDPMEYSRHDLNAAAIAARTLHRWSDPLSDPSWAADFLRAARTLRLRREDATPQAVKDGVLMARMRMGPRELDAATKVANDEARRLSEEFDEPSTGKVK